MKFKHSGPEDTEFSVCAAASHKSFTSRRKMTRLLSVMIIILFAGMTNTDVAYSENREDEDTETNQNNGLVIDLNPDASAFNGQGNGNQSCEIVIVNPGIINPSIENTELSSKVYGGRPGVAQVTTTNASYNLSIDQPLGFVGMPVGGGDSVNMTTQFSGNGATSFSETPGNVQVRLGRGTTLIETHLSARRLSGDPFPTGDYSAQLNLRCE